MDHPCASRAARRRADPMSQGDTRIAISKGCNSSGRRSWRTSTLASCLRRETDEGGRERRERLQPKLRVTSCSVSRDARDAMEVTSVRAGVQRPRVHQARRHCRTALAVEELGVDGL